jgi:hypothetical protein
MNTNDQEIFFNREQNFITFRCTRWTVLSQTTLTRSLASKGLETPQDAGARRIRNPRTRILPLRREPLRWLKAIFFSSLAGRIFGVFRGPFRRVFLPYLLVLAGSLGDFFFLPMDRSVTLGPASGAPGAAAPAPGRVMRVSAVALIGPGKKKKTKEAPRIFAGPDSGRARTEKACEAQRQDDLQKRSARSRNDEVSR